ncbi:DNA-protecting protein DprA [Blastococcus sp. MG754426]|uniref:DNA-processing protein DprA n=1 Tax=unclassified Blastococcus TaxID=2619396 RepID=UPI001EF1142F|nr:MULTISPECIES: DNA-processing protein DprA [unclassified Blastococcus]MCF6505826.1 DNA-protecting protein DprA [Blastococcus sp. MG754426]MCF6511094.1 DNA-protecting protein DprA [Blastococcus sp. MG754427]MCF6734984.1 DNA-protecting protein DprA [Blastococcus sp. KM273129]
MTTLEEDLEDAAAAPPEAGVVHPGLRRARAWLSRAVEPGTVDLWRWVEDVGPVEAVRRLRAGNAPSGTRSLVGARAEEDATLADLRRAERCGARLVVPEDDEWPAYALHALTVAVAEEPVDRKDQTDRTRALVPPVALWVRGAARLDVLTERSVAVVGARASSAYGEHVAGELGHQLGERGWTVVSGGAFGIDGAAHRGALAAGAPTVAVLSCGVDRPYPAGNGALFHRIAEDGLLVSEWPPGCAPLRHRFLVRNRLIAALTRGTVVVEAAARSGAQATAHRAQKLGRPVMVVPGPVTSALSVGCHELLRDEHVGAVLVTSAAHVVEAVGRLGEDLAPPVERPDSPRDGLSDVAVRVLDACPVRTGVGPERLARGAGCDVLDVLRVLPALELAQLVEWTGTGWRLAPPPKPPGAAP